MTSGLECHVGMRKCQVVRLKRQVGPGWAASCEPQWSVGENSGIVAGIPEGGRHGWVCVYEDTLAVLPRRQ